MDFDKDDIARMLRERAQVALECMVALQVIAAAKPSMSAEALRDFARDTLRKLPLPGQEPTP